MLDFKGLWRDLLRDVRKEWEEVLRLAGIQGNWIDGSHVRGGVLLKVSAANVSNPPSDADLDGIWTGPATVGNGFLALLDDAGAHTNVYLVASDGTSWWTVALTKAT